MGVRTIEVEVDDMGSVKIETSGFMGSECLKATEDLEKALGQMQQRDKKKEFYQVATNQQGQKGGLTAGS